MVSLNCGTGQSKSVREVAAWNPDVVLLQEPPGEKQLAALSQELFGPAGVAMHGGDVSIITSGKIRASSSDLTRHFIHSEVQLSSGLKLDVISVRLTPPVSRLDFWTLGFWSEHRNKRVEHRQQAREIIQSIQSNSATDCLIVGGDLNVPPNDASLAPFRILLFDTFRKAGRGWGGTGTNRYPLFRVDQIWASKNFRAVSVTAHKTQHSDHRMIVCDLVLDELK